MMIPRDDLLPVLAVEMAGDMARADEITEKHRQMAALALGYFAWFAAFDNGGLAAVSADSGNRGLG